LDKLRLFVAADLPERLKGAVEEEMASAPKVDGVKQVKPFQLHFTLKFLGYLGEDAVPEVSRLLEKAAAAHPPLSLRLEDCGAFPSPARARVLWLGCSGDIEEMRALAKDVDGKMTRVGVEREKRPYKAHLTLARCRDPRDVSGMIDGWRNWLAGREGLAFSVGKLVLYRSILDASGPTYHKLDEFDLKGGR
jgi:RNA 2',3'-cyclic 3'-phosphodiesterase